MARSKEAFLLVALTLACSLSAAVSFEELGRLHDCTPVEGSTSEHLGPKREGEFRQPHWFIYSSDNQAGISWCESPGPYGPIDGILVLVKDSSHPWSDCPSFFMPRTSRGGAYNILPRLIDEQFVGAPTLEYFRSVESDYNDDGYPGPPGVVPVAPGIVVDHGGAGAMYYCHDGMWWWFGYH